MTTKAELECKVEELEARLAESGRPAEAAVVSLSYDSRGALLAVAASRLQTADELRAMKAALAQVAQQTDMLLLAAVEREAREAATGASPEA